ncbi:MAG TPA: cytochrome c oxidase subunit 4 [Ktedonobacteraceae bacterium]
MAEKSGQGKKQPEQPADKRANMPLQVQLSPRPSFWPVVLALTLVITCIGVITHPILLGVGAALTVAAIIGWMCEKH